MQKAPYPSGAAFLSLYAALAVGFGVCGSDTDPGPDPASLAGRFCAGEGPAEASWWLLAVAIAAPLTGMIAGQVQGRWKPVGVSVAAALALVVLFAVVPMALPD